MRNYSLGPRGLVLHSIFWPTCPHSPHECPCCTQVSGSQEKCTQIRFTSGVTRSLHTLVFVEGGTIVFLQVLTPEMLIEKVVRLQALAAQCLPTAGNGDKRAWAMPRDSGQCPGTSGQCPGTSGQCPRKCPGTSGHGPRVQCPGTSGQCPRTAGIETHVGHSERPRTTFRTSRGHLRMSRENQTCFWDVPQMARGWPQDVLGCPTDGPGMALGCPGMAPGLPGCPRQPPLKGPS